MRALKRICALFLAVAMCFCLCISAAAEETAKTTYYKLTINKAATNHTYTAYQIFSGTLAANTDDATKEDRPYILSDIVWGNGIDTTKTIGEKTFLQALAASSTLKTPVTDDDGNETGSYTQDFEDGMTAKEVAEVLEGYATDSTKLKAFAEIAAKYTSTSSGTGSLSGTTYTISSLTAGYYLVKDSFENSKNTADGDFISSYIIEVVGDATADVKGSAPTVEKKVKENGAADAAYADYADCDIGDTVNFQLTGTLPSNYDEYYEYVYEFHDVLSDGLTCCEEKSVKVYVQNLKAGSTDEYDNPVEITGGFEVQVTNGVNANNQPISMLLVIFGNLKADSTDDEGYYVTAKDGDAAAISATTKIIVEYTATLNSRAVVGSAGNSNKVYLEYSNNPYGDGTGGTVEDEVKVYTWEIPVYKYYTKENSEEKTPLSSASFVLYRKTTDANNNEVFEYAIVDSTTNKLTGWTTYKTTSDIPEGTAASAASTLTSGVDGKITISGLDSGTYYLEETKAPDGYNSLDEAVKVVISAAADATDTTKMTDSVTYYTSSSDTTGTTLNDATTAVQIENKKGSELPSTGGMGTTAFYVVGGVLVVGAAVLLIVRKRMQSYRDEEE